MAAELLWNNELVVELDGEPRSSVAVAVPVDDNIDSRVPVGVGLLGCEKLDLSVVESDPVDDPVDVTVKVEVDCCEPL